MLTIEPFTLCATMRRPAACATSQTPFRLVPTTLSQSASSCCSAARVAVTPALLMTIWTGPKRCSAVRSAVSMLAATVTSMTTLWACPLAAEMSSTVLAKASARRAATVTRAPRPARNAAKNRQRPLEPPVTSTCIPSMPNRSLIANLLQPEATSLDLVPDQDRSAHGAVFITLVGSRRDCQRLALQHEVPDLIGAGPRLVPRGVDMMNDHVLTERKRAGIGDHRSEQFDAFFIGRHHVARHDAIIPRKDGVHPAIRRVTDIADGGLTELIVAMPIRQPFADIAAQPPRSDYRAAGRRFAGLHRCQDFLLCRQVVLPLIVTFVFGSRTLHTSKNTVSRSPWR